MNNQYAPLKIANEIEAQQDWSLIMRELPILATWISKTFAVDLSEVLKGQNNIIFQESEPQGEDADLLWVNSTGIPFVAVPVSGGYEKIYPYPPNVPFLWTRPADDIPSYMRPLSSTEMESMGLSLPDASEYTYIILEP